MFAHTKTHPVDLASLVRQPLTAPATLVRVTPTNEEILEKQLFENNRIEKEQEIVQKQLLLPPDMQNKELLEKYKLSANNAIVNGYKPESDSRGIPLFYHYRCYFPADPEVPYEHRPIDNYNVEITDIFSTRGDKFTFFFPVARSSIGGKIAYQLDNFNTFLDTQGDLILDEGIFDIYQALVLFKQKNTEYESKIVDVFNRYGIVESPIQPGGLYSNSVQLDFRIKNKNISVSAIPIVGTETETKPKPKGEKDDLIEKTRQKIIEQESKIKKPDFFYFENDVVLTMSDLDFPTKLDNVYSTSIGILKQFRFFESFNNGIIHYSIINGTIPGVNYPKLEQSIAQHNEEFLNAWNDNDIKLEMNNKTLLKVIQAKIKFSA